MRLVRGVVIAWAFSLRWAVAEKAVCEPNTAANSPAHSSGIPLPRTQRPWASAAELHQIDSRREAEMCLMLLLIAQATLPMHAPATTDGGPSANTPRCSAHRGDTAATAGRPRADRVHATPTVPPPASSPPRPGP